MSSAEDCVAIDDCHCATPLRRCGNLIFLRSYKIASIIVFACNDIMKQFPAVSPSMRWACSVTEMDRELPTRNQLKLRSQTKNLSSIIHRGYQAVGLLDDSDGVFDKFGIGCGETVFGVHDVVFHADPDMAAHRHRSQ